MSATPITIPPLLTALIGHLAVAVPARARTTFTELLVGTATTRDVTDAILAAGLTRSWTTYSWFLEYGRWAWLAVWQALLTVLTALFAPAVWYVGIDGPLGNAEGGRQWSPEPRVSSVTGGHHSMKVRSNRSERL